MVAIRPPPGSWHGSHVEELREVLRDQVGGVEKVIRALDHLRKQFPRRDEIRRCAADYRKHRARMNYAAMRADGLMIGSGLVSPPSTTPTRLERSVMRRSPRTQSSTFSGRALPTPARWLASCR